MSRFLAIPLFLFSILMLSMVGMIGDLTHTLGSGWSPGKTFAFTLMTMLALAGGALLLGAGYVVVEGFPF